MAKKRSSTQKTRSAGDGSSGAGQGKRAKLATKMKKYSKNAPKNTNKEKMFTGNHSMNPDRKKTSGTQRDKATINRLRMYKNSKPIRNDRGHIVKAAPFQGTLASGTVARVEPNRKWFGNTRVVGQQQLQTFQQNLGKARADPFQVVMRQTKLPTTLLMEKAKQARVHVLDVESFAHTFGKKAKRKHARLSVDNLEGMATTVNERAATYNPEADRDRLKAAMDVWDDPNPTPLFRAGQSHRVWGELYKVLDSADVILQVLDARDPLGTRSSHVEQFLKKEKPHKHLVLVLNKVDLIPTWLTHKWVSLLSSEYPTVAFHASMQHSFGKSALIDLLRQYAKLHKDRQQISVGLIGYPNTGKSSIINTLRNKKVCKAAPLAGETKVWQYVTLMKRIYLIDCPGVVYPAGDSHTQLVLKGVVSPAQHVRVENVPQPETYIDGLLAVVRAEFMRSTYGVQTWTDSEDFLTQLAVKTGKLLKGGEPDLATVAKQLLNDFQRGKIPYFVKPTGCDEEPQATTEDAAAKAEAEKAEEAPRKEIDGEEDFDDTASLTDVGSTCSGLSDMSGVSDLDLSSDDQQDAADKEETALKKQRQHQRGGLKHRKTKKKLKVKEQPFETFAGKASASGAKFWKKKKRKPTQKHQQ